MAPYHAITNTHYGIITCNILNYNDLSIFEFIFKFLVKVNPNHDVIAEPTPTRRGGPDPDTLSCPGPPRLPLSAQGLLVCLLTNWCPCACLAAVEVRQGRLRRIIAAAAQAAAVQSARLAVFSWYGHASRGWPVVTRPARVSARPWR